MRVSKAILLGVSLVSISTSGLLGLAGCKSKPKDEEPGKNQTKSANNTNVGSNNATNKGTQNRTPSTPIIPNSGDRCEGCEALATCKQELQTWKDRCGGSQGGYGQGGNFNSNSSSSSQFIQTHQSSHGSQGINTMGGGINMNGGSNTSNTFKQEQQTIQYAPPQPALQQIISKHVKEETSHTQGGYQTPTFGHSVNTNYQQNSNFQSSDHEDQLIQQKMLQQQQELKEWQQTIANQQQNPSVDHQYYNQQGHLLHHNQQGWQQGQQNQQQWQHGLQQGLQQGQQGWQQGQQGFQPQNNNHYVAPTVQQQSNPLTGDGGNLVCIALFTCEVKGEIEKHAFEIPKKNAATLFGEYPSVCNGRDRNPGLLKRMFGARATQAVPGAAGWKVGCGDNSQDQNSYFDMRGYLESKSVILCPANGDKARGLSSASFSIRSNGTRECNLSYRTVGRGDWKTAAGSKWKLEQAGKP